MRKHVLLNLLCIAAFTLGGCSLDAPGGQPTAQPALPAGSPNDSVTITFGAIGFMRHVYEPLIAAFNQQHPGIVVQFVALDEVYRRGPDQNEQLRQIVSHADTAEASASAEHFQLGLLRDLTPLIEGDPDFDRDDFYPSALSTSTATSGAIYKLPQSLEVALLFYNKDIWDARGVALPGPDWSWQDVTAAARQLARRQGDTIDIYGLADGDAYLAVLLSELRDAGLDLLSASPDSVRIDRPEVVAALQRMADLFTSGAFFDPPPGQNWGEQVDRLIAEQKLAMWGSGSGAGGSAEGQPPSFRRGVAPFPPFPGGSRDFASGWVMSSGTQHPDQAWAWLSFLSKQQIALNTSGKGATDQLNVLPARRSLAEQRGYWSRLDEETRAAVQTALGQPAPGADMRQLEIYQPLIEAIQQIAGGRSAALAASQAQAAIAEQFARAQQTPAVTPSSEPIVVATPAPNMAAPDATTITFGMPLAKGSDRASQFAQEFNQANPSVFVQLKDTFTGNGIMSASEAAAQTDCFTSPLPPAPGELTATLDLQPLIDADASFPRDDYPAALLTPYQQGGRLYGLPWGMIVRVLVYNRELFDAAGLAPPDETWTIDDFQVAAERLSSGSGETRQYGFVIPRSRAGAGKFLIHLHGAALVEGSGDTLRPNYSDPKVLQAAREVVEMLKHSTPHTRLSDYGQADQQFDLGELTGQGRAGMWFAWGLYAYGQEQLRFTMAMAPPPLGQSVLDADDIATTGLYISAGTDKQQACWLWLRALSATTLDGMAGFPARRSVAQSDGFNQTMPGAESVYRAYIQALDRTGQLAPGGDTLGTPPIDYFWLYRALDRALAGRNLERELAEAQALTELYIACVRAGDRRRDCAGQADPQYGQY